MATDWTVDAMATNGRELLWPRHDGTRTATDWQRMRVRLGPNNGEWYGTMSEKHVHERL
jgi:hypothetical protein